MADTETTNLKLRVQTVGGNDNTWGGYLNTNLEEIDDKFGDVTAVATTGGTVTLTEEEARVAAVKLTGVLGSAATLVLPARGGVYVIDNRTTGSFGLTVKVSGQTGVLATQGYKTVVYFDGTDIVKANNEIPDLSAYATLASPALSGNPTAPTPTPGDNDTSIATTGFVKAAIDVILGGVAAAGDTLAELYTLVSAKISTSVLDTDGTLAANSDAKIATQKAVKTYVDAAAASGVPAGVVAPYAGAVEPSGWLLCFGQAVSRSTYADLFTAISTTYGVGDGSTTFNVPDLRGRVVAGQDDMGGSSANRLTGLTNGVNGDTLGGTGGEEAHTLTQAQLPNVVWPVSAGATMLKTTGGGSYGYAAGADPLNAQVSSGGSDTPLNVVQPTVILNYIICTG